MATKSRKTVKTPAPKTEARMRKPMTRAEVHALMQSQASIILGALNELEGRIQALEGKSRTRESGLVLLSDLERAQ